MSLSTEVWTLQPTPTWWGPSTKNMTLQREWWWLSCDSHKHDKNRSFFKINRYNVTKEALLWCNLPQRFLDGALVRVTKVRHVHPSWTRSFLNSPETKFAHMDRSTKTFLSQHLENWILFLPLICKNFTWKFEYVPLRCTHLFIHNLHKLI